MLRVRFTCKAIPLCWGVAEPRSHRRGKPSADKYTFVLDESIVASVQECGDCEYDPWVSAQWHGEATNEGRDRGSPHAKGRVKPAHVDYNSNGPYVTLLIYFNYCCLQTNTRWRNAAGMLFALS